MMYGWQVIRRMNMEDILRLQRARMGAHNGYTSHDEMNSSIFDDFETNPAYQLVSMGDITTGVHIIKKQTRFGEIEVHMITRPNDDFPVGTYAVDRDGTKWLCHMIEDFPIRKHHMMPCNNTIKWQTDAGAIHEMDCVLTDKTSPFASGISSGKIISYPNDQIMVIIPDNEITKTIHSNKRFIFDNDRDAVYKDTTVDRLTVPTLQIKLRHDVYIPARDSLELNLADYVEWSDRENKPDNITSSYINLDGGSKVNVITPLSIKATVYIDDIESEQEVEFSLSNNLATISSQDGRNCTIQANKNWSFGDVVLTARSKTDGSVIGEKFISVVSL